MSREINADDFLKNIEYWSDKSDDECIDLATINEQMDAEEALTNLMSKDFAKEIKEELWDYYSGLPNPLFYQKLKESNNEQME